MDNPESLTRVNDICDKAKSSIFDILIEDHEKKLAVERERLASIRDQKRCKVKKKVQTVRKTKKHTELADL